MHCFCWSTHRLALENFAVSECMRIRLERNCAAARTAAAPGLLSIVHQAGGQGAQGGHLLLLHHHELWNFWKRSAMLPRMALRTLGQSVISRQNWLLVELEQARRTPCGAQVGGAGRIGEQRQLAQGGAELGRRWRGTVPRRRAKCERCAKFAVQQNPEGVGHVTLASEEITLGQGATRARRRGAVDLLLGGPKLQDGDGAQSRQHGVAEALTGLDVLAHSLIRLLPSAKRFGFLLLPLRYLSVTKRCYRRLQSGQILVHELYGDRALADGGGASSLTELKRTSPATKIPGTLVSSRKGSRSSFQAAAARAFMSWPARMKPCCRRGRSPGAASPSWGRRR